jgi:hypothetical protein
VVEGQVVVEMAVTVMRVQATLPSCKCMPRMPALMTKAMVMLEAEAEAVPGLVLVQTHMHMLHWRMQALPQQRRRWCRRPHTQT